MPAFEYPWHHHSELELTWILKGSGLRHVGDSVEPFHAGDFCLLGSRLPHTWLSTGGTHSGASRSLVVQFDPGLWGEEFLGLPEFAGLARLFVRAACGLCFDRKTGARLRAKILRSGSPLRQFTALLEILEELAAVTDVWQLALAPWRTGSLSKEDDRLGQAFAYLSANTGRAVSQAEAAKLVRLGPAAFSRFFRRATGKTFQDYLTDLRLSEACRQLLQTRRTVSEIAFAVGFGNLSNFNRAFRLRRGVPPTEFRRAVDQSQ